MALLQSDLLSVSLNDDYTCKFYHTNDSDTHFSSRVCIQKKKYQCSLKFDFLGAVQEDQ